MEIDKTQVTFFEADEIIKTVVYGGLTIELAKRDEKLFLVYTLTDENQQVGYEECRVNDDTGEIYAVCDGEWQGWNPECYDLPEYVWKELEAGK